MVTLYYKLKRSCESWRLVCLLFQHLMRKIKKENFAAQWQRWFVRFENLMVALDVKDDKHKRALLLHYMGESTFDIFETLAETGTVDDYKKACDALNKQFIPPEEYLL